MGPVMQWVNQLPTDPLTLDIYPTKTTSYTLYEDDGISTEYANGAYSTTKFTSANNGKGEVVTIGASTGDYKGKPATRNYVLKVNQQKSQPKNVVRDGVTTPRLSSRAAFDDASAGWYFDAAAHIMWIKFRQSALSATSVRF